MKLFNSIEPPIQNPTWTDVQPILYQYYYLYAYMASIVDVSNYDAVVANAQGIKQVFSLPFSDPRDFAAGRIEAGATLFYNRYDDLIDFDFETFTHLNRSEVEARGVELSLGWKPVAHLTVHTNATWQRVEDLTTRARLRHRPKWVGGARLDWRPIARLDLQLDFQGVSRSFDEQIPVPERSTVSGYGIVGLAGSWRFADRWQLRGKVDNLADRDYEALIGFPGPGRSLRLGLRYGT